MLAWRGIHSLGFFYLSGILVLCKPSNNGNKVDELEVPSFYLVIFFLYFDKNEKCTL